MPQIGGRQHEWTSDIPEQGYAHDCPWSVRHRTMRVRISRNIREAYQAIVVGRSGYSSADEKTSQLGLQSSLPNLMCALGTHQPTKDLARLASTCLGV